MGPTKACKVLVERIHYLTEIAQTLPHKSTRRGLALREVAALTEALGALAPYQGQPRRGDWPEDERSL